MLHGGKGGHVPLSFLRRAPVPLIKAFLLSSSEPIDVNDIEGVPSLRCRQVSGISARMLALEAVHPEEC